MKNFFNKFFFLLCRVFKPSSISVSYSFYYLLPFSFYNILWNSVCAFLIMYVNIEDIKFRSNFLIFFFVSSSDLYLVSPRTLGSCSPSNTAYKSSVSRLVPRRSVRGQDVSLHVEGTDVVQSPPLLTPYVPSLTLISSTLKRTSWSLSSPRVFEVLILSRRSLVT